jgi:hypothetical protein
VRSRYKFDRWLKSCQVSRRLVNGHLRSIAVQVVKEPEIDHGIESNLRADARFDSRSFSEGWSPDAKTTT